MASTIAAVVGGLLTVAGAAPGVAPEAVVGCAGGALEDDGPLHAVTTSDTATTAVK
jgi:hypothetical protein